MTVYMDQHAYIYITYIYIYRGEAINSLLVYKKLDPFLLKNLKLINYRTKSYEIHLVTCFKHSFSITIYELCIFLLYSDK